MIRSLQQFDFKVFKYVVMMLFYSVDVVVLDWMLPVHAFYSTLI